MADDSKELRKRENTRARLIEAAADVFVEKGLEGAKIDDVVKAAGFSRGAFYSNYSTMQELMRDVIVERSQRILDTVDAVVAGLDVEPTLDSIMGILEAIHGEGRAMYILTTEFSLYRMRHPEAFADAGTPLAERQDFEERLSGVIVEILSRLGRRPLFPTGTIARVISVFYLDALVSGDEENDELLRHVIEVIIVAFSEPIEGGVLTGEEGVDEMTAAGVGHLISYIKASARQ